MIGIEGIIDRGAALERLGGDEELLDELVEIFVQQMPAMLAEIREAVVRGDSKALQLSAHSLKGSAANLSAMVIFEKSRQLEMMARNGDLTNSKDVFAAIEAEMDRLRTNLEAAA